MIDLKTGKCPKCGKMSLCGDSYDIWCDEDDCDFTASPCKNDGKCLVVLNFGDPKQEVDFFGEPCCECETPYTEVENKETEAVDALLKEKFPGLSWEIWYHTTWWEEDGLAEDPLRSG